MNQYKIVDFQKILKLPKLTNSDFGWYVNGPDPMIIVLCADEEDRDRLRDHFPNLNEMNNKLKLVLCESDIIGLNPFAIYKSYKVDEKSKIFEKSVERVNLRCGQAIVGGTYNLFCPAWVVLENKIEEN